MKLKACLFFLVLLTSLLASWGSQLKIFLLSLAFLTEAHAQNNNLINRIYLIDSTTYNESKKDLKNEFDNIIKDMKSSVNGDVYKARDTFENLSISFGVVDDNGANSIELCTRFSDVQDEGKKKMTRKMMSKIEAIEKCFQNHWEKIRNSDSSQYKKTLYVEAISKTLKYIKSNRENFKKHEIIILGDLAIVDSDCFLEDKNSKNQGCKCHKTDKLKRLKNEIVTLQKEVKLSICAYSGGINISGEEICRFQREDIWNEYIFTQNSCP